MNEIEIINKLKKIIKNKNALNLNDDVFFDEKKGLVASIDTYNENIHYINFKNPHLIIKKVIRSTISDVISKGVDPKYLLISFASPKVNFTKKNIKLIINSIKHEQNKFKFSLIGGDTTLSSKSSFTICVFSFSKKIIKRNNCYKNDDIYVTGNIGDASVGLSILKKKINPSLQLKKYFISKYYKPDLAFGFHRNLYKFANSAMDVSDGLLSDIKKLVSIKKFKFIINLDQVPKSANFKKLIIHNKNNLNNHLFKGDDYQILFTAKKKYRKTIIRYAKNWNQKITIIGNITNGKDNYLKIDGKLKKIKDYQGYIHNFR